MGSDKQTWEVAQKVLGWKFWQMKLGKLLYVVAQIPGEREPWAGLRAEKRDCYTPIDFRDIDRGKHIIHITFDPLGNANDDYLVLEHVRKTWDISRLLRFSGMCDDQWNSRGVGTALQYQLGDYSRAALRALEQSNGT